MMTVNAYFERDSLASAVARLADLQSLPKEYRPTHFGTSERRPARENALSDTRRYEQFRQDNGFGYFLFAERCRYNITAVFEGGFGTVSVDAARGRMSDEAARNLHDAMRLLGAPFVFSCDFDEYLHRNRYVRRLGANTVESWVGRALSKYVPGLYWTTWLASDLVRRHHVPDLRMLLPDAVLQDESEGLLLRMTGASQEWKNWEAELDEVCERHPGIFSIRRIKATLDDASDYASLSERLRETP